MLGVGGGDGKEDASMGENLRKDGLYKMVYTKGLENPCYPPYAGCNHVALGDLIRVDGCEQRKVNLGLHESV